MKSMDRERITDVRPTGPRRTGTKKGAARRARICLCAAWLLTGALLCGCASAADGPGGGTAPLDGVLTGPPESSPGTGDASPVTGPAAPGADGDDTRTAPEDDVGEAALRSYYEELVASLRRELIDEKSARYISDHEYRTRMDALEAELAGLREPDGPGGDVPASDTPDPTPISERETEPPPARQTEPLPADDEQPPTAAYRYGVKNGTTVIHEYLGTSRTVAVPALVGGHPVTAIADNAFRDKGVTAVILPDTVVSIGWFAFSGCFPLETLTIPASVTSIAYGALDGCPNVTILCRKGSYADRWAQSYGMRIQYI